jgi:hypothetical protein
MTTATLIERRSEFDALERLVDGALRRGHQLTVRPTARTASRIPVRRRP